MEAVLPWEGALQGLAALGQRLVEVQLAEEQPWLQEEGPVEESIPV